MPFNDLLSFVSALEKAGELVRITEPVSPSLEISEITDRVSKSHGPALLFEQTGTGFPVLINALGSEKRICLALGVSHLDEIGERIQALLTAFSSPKERFLDKVKILPMLQELSSWMPRTRRGRGACQEVVMPEPDLTKFPVLTCWPADGGAFITLPCVHTRGTEAQRHRGTEAQRHRGTEAQGARNVGMYRMQVFGPTLTGMHWHLHKGSAHHYLQYKNAGLRMPVSVTLGGDPVYTYAATAPLPENLDEYLLAGFLRKRRVDMVRCLTNDLEVPADADIVIEGYVDPAEELILEGPFGDHTGFYSLADVYPRFHVTCITHRRNAIYPATIVGIPPQEDGWIGRATERIFLTPMKLTVAPELTDIHMPEEGVFHNIVLASINPTYPGQPEKVMNALWGAGQMMFNKILVITGQGTHLTDYVEVARLITQEVDPVEDIHFIRGPVDILDHASRRYAAGSKIGLDATGSNAPRDNGIRASVEKTENAWNGKIFLQDVAQIREKFPEISQVNASLPAMGIGCIIIAVNKTRRSLLREIAQAIGDQRLFRSIPFILFTDPAVDPLDLPTVVWLGANNIDPMRDCFYVESAGIRVPVLFADTTRKTMNMDGFSREWPNVITMDDATIRRVDEKWNRLGLGAFIPSPSLKYKMLVVGGGAVAG